MSTGPSLYRRHRPRTFADVVGQEHVVRTLRNAVQRGKVHHAYLFVGSRGTGKTSMAKILAACMNCVEGPTVEPCGRCESCVAIASATSLDVIEMDAASNNSVDDIRDLRDRVAYAPVSGRHKVYILDEAHMLSTQAWNAFLKTLEEPPPRTIFVLATTEAQKVLPTVVDRCHRFDFGRPSAEQVATVLRRVADSEKIEIDDHALALIARNATGSFRDALGTLEQLLTYKAEERIEPDDVLAVLGVADDQLLFEAVAAGVERDPGGALRVAARLSDSGRDPGQALRDLEIYARELLTVQILGEVPAELRVTPDRDARLAEQARAVSRADAVRLLDLIAAALEATANGAQAQIQLELVLIKAAAPELDPSTSALMARIERLEAQGDAVVTSGVARTGMPASPPTSASGASTGMPASPPTSASGASTGTPASPPTSETRASTSASSTPTPTSAPAPTPSPTPSSTPAPPPDPAPGPTTASTYDRASVTSTAGAPPPPPLDLAAAAALWPAVVQQVRERNAMLAGLLETARPAEVSERELTVVFPAGADFFKRKAEQDEHRRMAVEALRSVSGRSMQLRYELGDHDGGAEETLSGEELVRRFIEEFDAEELLDDEHDQHQHEREAQS